MSPYPSVQLLLYSALGSISRIPNLIYKDGSLGSVKFSKDINPKPETLIPKPKTLNPKCARSRTLELYPYRNPKPKFQDPCKENPYRTSLETLITEPLLNAARRKATQQMRETQATSCLTTPHVCHIAGIWEPMPL